MNRYELNESGHWYETVEADSATAAIEIARDNVDRSNYPCDDEDDRQRTLYIDVRARNVADHDDEEIATVVLPPEEPDCTGDEHKWTAPFDLVGGCRENPGVWGHGCGIIIHEVCSHCGVRRVTDTWAHRRDNGEQGFTEVRYERPRVER